MNDPTRWRDGADDLPSDVRASLRATHGPSRPNAGERAAMVAFAAKLGAVPPPSLHPLARLGGWKVIGLAGLVTAIGATTIPMLRHRAFERAASVASAHVNTVVPPVPAPLPTATGSGAAIEGQVATDPTVAAATHEAPAMAPSAPHAMAIATTAHANPRQHTTPTAATTAIETTTPAAHACPIALSGTADEERVIRAATSALGSDPALTLSCVHALSSHGGPSQLRDEYWFLGFEASRRLGHTADARQWGESLLRGAADSPYAARVRQWIAGTSGQ